MISVNRMKLVKIHLYDHQYIVFFSPSCYVWVWKEYCIMLSSYFILRRTFSVMVQLHSIFLHVRKVRRMVGFRDAKSPLVKLEWLLNWFTFFVARTLSHILITVKLIKDAQKFGKGVELPLALFGMAGMNLLNIGLGLDLCKAFKRERKSQQGNLHPHREWLKRKVPCCVIVGKRSWPKKNSPFLPLYAFRKRIKTLH